MTDIVFALREAAKLPKSAIAVGIMANAAADEIDRLRAIIAADTHTILTKRPVAFRVKDYADGWTLYLSEEVANNVADEMGGALVQGLYARDGN